MNKEELDDITAPARQIYRTGRVWGAAYFASPDHVIGLAMGNDDLSEGQLGVAIYRIIQARGFDVQRICGAVIMVAQSEDLDKMLNKDRNSPRPPN